MIELRNKAAAKGFNAYLTSGQPEENAQAINALDAAFLYINGHGSPCAITVACRQLFIQVPWQGVIYGMFFKCIRPLGTELVKNRHLHFLSCLTGLYLGYELVVRYGAKSFIGYDDLFAYGVLIEGQPEPKPGEPPSDNADFYSAIHSDLAGAEAIILNASTVRQAVEAIKKRFQEYIDRYTIGDWKDRPIAYWAALMLQHDLTHLVAYGNLDWKPYSAGEVKPSFLEMLARFVSTFSTSFGLAGILIPSIAKPE
jgi:hypothetical protein